MIANADRDGIFPLDGVVRTYERVRRIYELLGAGNDLGLNIVPGPHKDTQDLQVPAFRWFQKYLKKDTRTLIAEAAEKRFEPEELRVFQELPGDQLNSTIHETFVPAAAPPEVPGSPEQWAALRDGWRTALLEKSFRAWPEQPEPLEMQEAFSAAQDGICFRAYDFTSQGPVRLRLYLLHGAGQEKPERVTLQALDQQAWDRLLELLAPLFKEQLQDESLPGAAEKQDKQLAAKALFAQMQKLGGPRGWTAMIAPRGVGPTAFDPSEKKQTQIRRRFMLLGQTLDGMQVWDVRRAIQAIRQARSCQDRAAGAQRERRNGRHRRLGLALRAEGGDPFARRPAADASQRADPAERVAHPGDAAGGGHGHRALAGQNPKCGQDRLGISAGRGQKARLRPQQLQFDEPSP